MKFYFHPDAKEEFDGAVEYYEPPERSLVFKIISYCVSSLIML